MIATSITCMLARELLRIQSYETIKRGFYAHWVASDFIRNHSECYDEIHRYLERTNLSLGPRGSDKYTHLGVHAYALFVELNPDNLDFVDSVFLSAHRHSLYKLFLWYLLRECEFAVYRDADTKAFINVGDQLVPCCDGKINQKLHALRVMSSEFNEASHEERALTAESLRSYFLENNPGSDLLPLINKVHDLYFSRSSNFWKKAALVAGSMAAGAYAGKKLGQLVTGRRRK